MVRPLLQRPGRHSTECIIRWMVIVVTLIAHGCPKAAQGLLKKSQGRTKLNTAFIERLNATFRSCLAVLVRRSRALIRNPQSWSHSRI